MKKHQFIFSGIILFSACIFGQAEWIQPRTSSIEEAAIIDLTDADPDFLRGRTTRLLNPIEPENRMDRQTLNMYLDRHAR